MIGVDLNKWLTLLANISVVAGIIFLAVQVRQNTETLEQNALYMRLALEDVGYEQTADWRNMLVQDKNVGELWERGVTLSSIRKRSSTTTISRTLG